MFGISTISKKNGKKTIKHNPPSAKAKAAARQRQFIRFVKSFAVDRQKPGLRGWAAKRILREAAKYRAA